MDFLTDLIDRSLLVADRELMATDREANEPREVTVINTSGAGGLVALAGRAPQHLRIVAVDNTVRDTVDPAQNIARIAAAARELDPDILVRVAIPPDCQSYDDAVATVEAEGLQGLLIDQLSPDQTAAQLGAFIEADLPFAATVGGATELISLLLAIDALIDDGSVPTAGRLLAQTPSTERIESVRGWNDQHVARIRRRLAAVRTADLPALLEEVAAI